MKRTLELFGRVTKDGLPFISGMERFNQFFKDWKNRNFIIEITAIEKGTTNAHVWYILKMILPAVIQGEQDQGNLLTKEEALTRIMDICPIFEGQKPIFDFRKWQITCELSPRELETAIEYLHFYCLENYDIVIGNYKSI